MPVIKHVEFKIVCDECYSNITDYMAMQKTKAKTVKELEIKNNVHKKGKKYLCLECYNSDTHSNA